MNMPMVNDITIMNASVRGSRAPATSGRPKEFRKSVILQIQYFEFLFLLRQHFAPELELLRVNAGAVFAYWNSVQVESFYQFKHPVRSALVKLQFQNDTVFRKRRHVRRQIGPPAFLRHLQAARSIVAAPSDFAVKSHSQFFIFRRLPNLAKIGNVNRAARFLDICESPKILVDILAPLAMHQEAAIGEEGFLRPSFDEYLPHSFPRNHGAVLADDIGDAPFDFQKCRLLPFVVVEANAQLHAI